MRAIHSGRRFSPAVFAFMVLAASCSSSSPTSPAGTPSSVPDPLAISGLRPQSGSTVGGTVLTILGSGFAPGAAVTLGGLSAQVQSVAKGTLTVVTPPNTQAELVDVVVTNPDRTNVKLAQAFQYVRFPGPSITAITADPGSTVGGAWFSIVGSGFEPGARVSFGGVVAASGLVEGELRGTTPPHAAGRVDVAVTNPDGQGDALESAYTYVEPDTLDFNGTWVGGGTEGEVSLRFNVRDNSVADVECNGRAVALVPSPAIVNGAFAYSGQAGVFSGRIVTSRSSGGRMRIPSCLDRDIYWDAVLAGGSAQSR